MTFPPEQKLAIHELLYRWAYAFDERDLHMLENCFCEDATFSMRIAGGDMVGPFEGREAIMALMSSSLEQQTDVRRHVVSNMFFDERAEVPTVISNLTLFATENGEIQVLTAGIYTDEVKLVDGDWRLQKRHLELDKGY